MTDPFAGWTPFTARQPGACAGNDTDGDAAPRQLDGRDGGSGMSS
jgi:hypothetical protein